MFGCLTECYCGSDFKPVSNANDVLLPDFEKATGAGLLRLRNPTKIKCISIHQIATFAVVFE